MTSSELEHVYDWGQKLKGVVVGEILTCQPHPNADRLKVTTVSTGKETRTIVCGAPNVAAGQKVLVALPGTTLTNLKGEILTIAEATIRGVTSEGMLCAASELGLPALLPDGIWVLPAATQVGITAVQALGLDDVVLDLEITPNRPDLLSHIGLAREVSAFENRALKLPKSTPLRTGSFKPAFSSTVHVHVAQHAPCYRVAAVPLRVLQQENSPWWLQRRLIISGMRPINPIVDVTNYVMLELGQPLHAFDTTHLGVKKVVLQAEKVKVNTPVTTLDGITRTLEPGDAVITLNGTVADIAGIMGGEGSSITSTTQEVLLQAASFHGPQVRRTSARLGLRSEASTRFEKGLDPELVPQALERAVALLTEMGVVEQAGPLCDHYPEKRKSVADLCFACDRFEDIMGVRISITEAKHILEKLGFRILSTSKTTLHCVPPTWRSDVRLEEDVMEEVIRIWGFDRVPQTLPKGPVKVPQRNEIFYRKEAIRSLCARLHFQETVHLPFCSQRQLDLVGIEKAQVIGDPISKDLAFLSPTHLIAFLQSTAANQKEEQTRLFEIGKVFYPDCKEKLVLSALLRSSKNPERLFQEAKRLVEAVAGTQCTYTPLKQGLKVYDPAATYTVQAGSVAVGTIAFLTSKTAEAHKIRRGRLLLFVELDMEKILEQPERPVIYTPPAAYPAIERDMTIVVSEETPWSEVESAIKEVVSPLLEVWVLDDMFRGNSISKDQKALTVHFVYRGQDRTLTDAEVDEHQQALTQALTTNLSAQIS